MVEKRARKFQGVAKDVPTPELEGPDGAEVTLVGWGSTYGVIREAVESLVEHGVVANQLPIKWLNPFHGDEVRRLLEAANRVFIVENNHSGQFARYLRSETGFTAHGHIRKYDGEPFMPHHVADGVLELVKGESDVYVPYQEMIV
jgi:2-oxoglutarate ferredoxin oxidoreductase subunit alpha